MPRISQLPEATLPLAGTELVAVVQGGATKHAPASSFGAGSTFPTLHVTGLATFDNTATFSGKVKVGALGWLEALIPSSEQTSETNSISTSGGPGVLGATRTSDGGPGSTGSQGAWAIGGFAINNNASQVQTSYGLYLEARRSAGAGVTEGIEVVSINTGDVKQGSPLNWSQDGATMGILVGAGRDDVSGNANPTSGIVFAGSVAKWQTGIIFGRGSVATNGNYPVSPVAVDMPRQYSLLWRDSADVPAAYIRSDVTSSPDYHGAGGIVFTNGGMQLNTSNTGASVALSATGITASGNLNVEGQVNCDGAFAVAGTASFAGVTGLSGAFLIDVAAIGTYANDSAAAAGGVFVNQVYRNSSFGNCLKIRES